MHRPPACGWRRTRSLALAGWGACALVIASTSALWADNQPVRAATGSTEALFIVQIVLLLLVGRLLGEGMQRIGQPAVIGQLIAGIML